MAVVHVELQEGWTGEQVEMWVNGSRWYSGRPSTRLQIGYADAVVVNVSTGLVRLEVRLPEVSIEASRSMPIGNEHWIGVSRLNGTVLIVDQAAPFGYA
ncbi:MAG TPA: hypothetical protein VFR22_00980 [Nocardioidaceae bacterium]|jgi:hypothetical protein|nr:hypothetical protein [Nocardioidaceae bacterium]